NQKNILKQSRPQTRQKPWNTEYKQQYRMKQPRQDTNTNVYQNQSKCENKSWWDVLCTLGEPIEFCCNRGKHILSSLPAYPMDMDNILNDRNINTLS
ncbi:28907_t:CDS:2, partial [Racocetra persica]